MFFMKYKMTHRSTLSLMLSAAIFSSFGISASEKLLQKNCLGCHLPTQTSAETMKLSRISHQRKTPEGWSMTIARMQHTHGLAIATDERAQLVKYLSDTQGITPKEATPYRYILERRLNHQESKHPEIAEMCARCHSQARIGLQRRGTDEWEKLVHFHLGQWPSVEFSAMGRDRDWFEIAIDKVVPYLGKNYGLDRQLWNQWAAQPPQLADGRWRVVGSSPDKGDFHGVMTAMKTSDDTYGFDMTGQFNNGETFKGSGSAVIYSGFEWRGAITLNGVNYRQVFALENNGSALSGRMFEAEHEEMGVDISAQKSEKTAVMSVSPNYLKVGSDTIISIRGNHLNDRVTLPQGVEVKKIISQTRDEIQMMVHVAEDAVVKRHTMSVNGAALSGAIGLYRDVGSVEVFPSYAVARVGGEGSQNKVMAAFNAKAFSAGVDEKMGTTDDFYIGVMDATWRVEPFDQKAIDDQDVKFAGHMNSTTGVFTPGAAGPNPERKYGTNNAGRLRVVATLADEKDLEANAELIVTVQRWNNPPIR